MVEGEIEKVKCKSPLLAYWKVGEFTKNGKMNLTFKFPVVNSEDYEVIELPCGKCTACRVNASRRWAVRCVCESKLHEESYFVTLTVDDDHLKDAEGNVGVDRIKFMPTCCIDDVSAFIKRLRADQKYRYDMDGCKFLAASEYGEQSARPHYHLALFGIKHPELMDDGTPALKYFKKTSAGFVLYESLYLEKIWKQGNVIIGDVSAESAQYIAKYTTKNTDANKELWKTLNVEFPKLRMSRNPGIGKRYFDMHREEIMNDGELWIDGKSYPIPETWLSVAENNLEDVHDSVSKTLEKMNMRAALYEQRKHSTDKHWQEELNEFKRRPMLEDTQNRDQI